MANHLWRRLALATMLAIVATLAIPQHSGAVSGRAVYDKDHADPEIIRAEDGQFYAYATGRRRNNVRQNVPVMVSPDLVRWTELGDALWSLGSWAGSGPTWAPSVRKIGDQYVLHYGAARAGTSPRQLCIGRAVAPTPMGPFVDRWRSALICPHDGAYEAIDPSAFVDDDGTVYLHYKTSTMVDGANFTRIWSAVLNRDGTELASQPEPLLDATLAWEEGDVENPEMVAVGGNYWLLYSGSWWDTDRYATGVARCTHPQGPCVKQPRLLEADDARRGPGGASLVADRRGQWWIAYHGWVGRTRVLFVDGVDFGERTVEIDHDRLTPRSLPPSGALERVANYESYVRVSGWAHDGDDTLPIRVDVAIDGQTVRSVPADDYRPDLQGPFGYDIYVPVSLVGPGEHRVCVSGYDEGATPVPIGCRSLTLASA